MVGEDAGKTRGDGGVLRAGEGVKVRVDQAGRYVEILGVESLLCLGRRDLRLDGGDAPVGDSQVANGIDAVLRVEDMPALQQQVILGALSSQHRRQNEKRN